jgi:hypothetical protein
MNATRLLLIVIGVFLIARLVTKDSHNETLAGRIVGGQPSPPSSSSSGTTFPTTPLNLKGNPLTVGTATASEKGFATSFLKTIQAPVSKTNIAALEDWWAQEEGPEVLVPGHGGLNNPFEVTTTGNVNVPSLGDANSAGVKNYATEQQGIDAAIGYFEKYGNGSVIQAFQSNKGIASIEAAVHALGPTAFGSDTDRPWGL